MSDYFLKSELKSIDFKLKVTDCSLSYLNQLNVDDNDIALAVDIPYPVLIKCHVEKLLINDTAGAKCLCFLLMEYKLLSVLNCEEYRQSEHVRSDLLFAAYLTYPAPSLL